MKYELVIVADTNDADYVTAISEVTQEDLDELRPVFDAIVAYTRENRYGHNWPAQDYVVGTLTELYPNLTEEQIAIFDEYRPYGEYGIHTIASIVYYPVPFGKVKVL